MIERWIVLAGEEAGPVSNKMGGIWNVVDAEATTLARLVAQGEIESGLQILVLGPTIPPQARTGTQARTGSQIYQDSRSWIWGQKLDSVLATLNALRH